MTEKQKPLNTRLMKTLSEQIYQLWSAGHYTDVSIAINNQTFKCHKLILAAASDYFHAMFSSGMKESQEGCVTLVGVENTTFRSILDFIYTSANVVRTDNAEKLLEASVRFQISSLQNLCEDFLIDLLTSSNAITMWKIASDFACLRLQMEAFSFIIDNFSSICSTDAFSALDEEQLLKIIKDDSLNVADEEIVCDTVLKWVSACQSRASLMPVLFEHLKFRFTSVGFLDRMLENPLVHNNLKCQEIIEEARCYILLNSDPSKLPEGVTNSHKPRHEKVLCVIGARSRHPDPSKTEVTSFSFRQKSLFPLHSLPFEPGAGFALTGEDSKMYLSGGYMGGSRFLVYDGFMNIWKEKASLQFSRWCHVMVLLDKQLFVLGGYGTDYSCIGNIERYEETTNSWEVVGDLHSPVSSMSASCLGRKIFIFGGRDASSSETSCIQMFDLDSRQSTKVGDLPYPCAFSRSVSLDDKIFVIYRDGSIIEFSVESASTLLVGKLGSFDHFSCVVHGSKLLIVGSTNSVHRSVYFDLTTSCIENISHKLSTLLCNFHCVKILISRTFLTDARSRTPT